MATDFSYGKKQILSSGPFKPSGKNMPVDARTRVEVYADIESIPNPFIGMRITVLADETNSGKMTDYIVKSLKANNSGIADMAINEVVRYVDYLGASSGGSVSQEDINTAVNNYFAEHPVSGGVTMRDLVAGEIFIKETTSTPTVTYGNIVASTTNLTVNEGADATFTVKLDKPPSSNQVVNIAINNGYCVLSTTSLTFSASNYSTNQTVTVTALHDNNDYNNKNSIITLSSPNVSSKTVNVTINNIDEQPSETIPVQSITLNKTESTLNVGDSEQLTVTINPTNATNKNINWSSSDDGKATVTNGLVTAVTSGSVAITAASEDGNKTAVCNYTVQEVQSGGDFDPSLKMFLNGEGGSERYDSTNCLLWLDQSGNGNNYTFRKNNDSYDNDKLIKNLWQSDRYINLTANVTAITNSDNNNTNFTSLNFTWDIKIKYSTASLMKVIGNGTQTGNTTGAVGIYTQNGNILVRAEWDKIAFVEPLTTLMTIGNFYRITLTNDGTTAKLYLDGEFIASCDSSNFKTIAPNKPLATDLIDYAYIKYYDRALTDSEIQGGIM